MIVPDAVDMQCNDFERMLLNPAEMEAYLKRLKESCDNFDSKFEHNVSVLISKNSERVKELQKSSVEVAELLVQKKELKAALESVKLEQKVVEKKAIKRMKEMEKIKADIEIIKEKKEKISLEIVDLQEESEKQKEQAKKQWNALKKACSFYKNRLDIHISTEMIDHVEHVTVTFFWAENPTDKKFFVVLTNHDNCWKVKKIEPELSMETKYQLNHVVQFSKQSEIACVSSFLCELRKLFLKNYF